MPLNSQLPGFHVVFAFSAHEMMAWMFFNAALLKTLTSQLSLWKHLIISLLMSPFKSILRLWRRLSRNSSHLFVKRWSFYGFLLILFVPLDSVRRNKLKAWLKPGPLGSWGRQTDREAEGGGDGGLGWDRSFYMLSAFNLVRTITHQFTGVVNQMNVGMWAGAAFFFLSFPYLLKRENL